MPPPLLLIPPAYEALLRIFALPYAHSQTPLQTNCPKNRRPEIQPFRGLQPLFFSSKLASNQLFCCKRAGHGPTPILRTNEGSPHPQQLPLLSETVAQFFWVPGPSP